MKILKNPKTPRARLPYVVLAPTAWDDYGIKSAFALDVYIKGRKISIGEVKIIGQRQVGGRVQIPYGTAALPTDFCSLGQNIEYYKKLHQLGKEVETTILKMLRDCAYSPQIYNDFKDTQPFLFSAIRFSTAEQALVYGLELYSKEFGPAPKPCYSFSFENQLLGFSQAHKMLFEFFDDFKIPANINVLIGRNGTGKTQLLSELAKAISGYGYRNKKSLLGARANQFPQGRPSFGKIIVVSYSAFDSFEIPGKNKAEIVELSKDGTIFGYTYCGLRVPLASGKYRIKSELEVAKEFRTALNRIHLSGRKEGWKKVMSHVVADPSFFSLKEESLSAEFKTLSSGQKIIVSILANVLQHIESTTLVIVDEPETHLHPSLVSAFMHALREILNMHDSYAIVATHSPVILQETPSRFVQVLSGTSSSPMVKRLKSECFGEEVSTLTEDVFGVSFEESNFYTVLRGLSNQGLSLDEINLLFEKSLGMTARSFVSPAQ